MTQLITTVEWPATSKGSLTIQIKTQMTMNNHESFMIVERFAG